MHRQMEVQTEKAKCDLVESIYLMKPPSILLSSHWDYKPSLPLESDC